MSSIEKRPINKGLKRICLTDKFSDIYFAFPKEIDSKRIHAHKLILSLSSPVFEDMFYGTLAETSMEIKIEDISRSTFEILLRFLYADVIENMLSLSNVLDVINAARKYQVNELCEECELFLEKEMNVENVCTIYVNSKLFQIKSLAEKSFRYIANKMSEVIRTECFRSLSKEHLKEILESNRLNVKEINLFKSVMVWSQEECARKEIAVTPTNKRKVLGECLYLLRLPVMSLDEFRKVVVEDGVLTDLEENQMFRFITKESRFRIRPAKLKIAGFLAKARKVKERSTTTFELANICTPSNYPAHAFGTTPNMRLHDQIESVSLFSETDMEVTKLKLFPAIFDSALGCSAKMKNNTSARSACADELTSEAGRLSNSPHEIQEIATLTVDQKPLNYVVNKNVIDIEIDYLGIAWNTFQVKIIGKCSSCEEVLIPKFQQIRNVPNANATSQQHENAKTLTSKERSIEVECSGSNIIKSLEIDFLD